MGALLASLEALAFGYLTAVAVHFVLMLIITRLGRSMLTSGDRMNSLYTVLLGASWIASAASGATVAFDFAAPILPPYSSYIFTTALAALLILAASRIHVDARHQHALSGNIKVAVCIVIGTAVGCYLSLPPL